MAIIRPSQLDKQAVLGPWTESAGGQNYISFRIGTTDIYLLMREADTLVNQMVDIIEAAIRDGRYERDIYHPRDRQHA